MEDHELEAVSEGERQFTTEERQWAIDQHHFLAEYTKHDNPEILDDEILACDVLRAGWDYVRCTM